MPTTEYTKWVDAPMLRLRFYLNREGGSVRSFLIQVEYNGQMSLGQVDGWTPIARFDHNPSAVDGHDVDSEGLHLDLLDVDEAKHEVRRGFPDIPLDNSPEYCENYLLRYATVFAAQFEEWNGLQGRYRSE